VISTNANMLFAGLLGDQERGVLVAHGRYLSNFSGRVDDRRIIDVEWHLYV
jgi:hypothetical protein